MGKYLDKLKFNHSEELQNNSQPRRRTGQNKKLSIPTSEGCQKCQKGGAQAWGQSPAPDFRQLAAEVKAARRGQWITPTMPLLAFWRAVNTQFGTNLTSQQIGAVSRLVDANPTATNRELHQLCVDVVRSGENQRIDY